MAMFTKFNPPKKTKYLIQGKVRGRGTSRLDKDVRKEYQNRATSTGSFFEYDEISGKFITPDTPPMVKYTDHQLILKQNPRAIAQAKMWQSANRQGVDRFLPNVMIEHGSYKLTLWFSGSQYYLEEKTEDGVRKSIVYGDRHRLMWLVENAPKRITWIREGE